MIITHINYADRSWLLQQEESHQSALATGAFDSCLKLGIDDCDINWRYLNAKLLSQFKGAGYWVWKPHIIGRILNSLHDNDLLMYTDASCMFLSDPSPLLKLTERQPVVGFYLANHYPNLTDRAWTKRDVTLALHMENKDETPQIMGGILLFVNCPESRAFVAEWGRLCEIPHLIDDSPSVMFNYPEFKEHRHDQSILSLLYKRDRYYSNWPAPSDWGDRDADKRSRFGYDKIIGHPR